MNELQKSFGTNLKMLRVSLGLTQEELAERIGLDPKQISKIETGKHFPSSKTIGNLCYAINCQISRLFEFEYGPCAQQLDTDIVHQRMIQLQRLAGKIIKDDEKYKLILLAHSCFQDKSALAELHYITQGMRLKGR